MKYMSGMYKIVHKDGRYMYLELKASQVRVLHELMVHLEIARIESVEDEDVSLWQEPPYQNYG